MILYWLFFRLILEKTDILLTSHSCTQYIIFLIILFFISEVSVIFISTWSSFSLFKFHNCFNLRNITYSLISLKILNIQFDIFQANILMSSRVNYSRDCWFYFISFSALDGSICLRIQLYRSTFHRRIFVFHTFTENPLFTVF